MDIIVPTKEEKGAILLLVDVFTRYAVTRYFKDYTGDTLLTTFKHALQEYPSKPKLLVTDRQSGFTI